MNILNKISIFCLIALMTLCFGSAAFAAKTLSLSTNVSVSNTGNDDDPTRIATLDLNLEGGASDVNGLVFTLTYDPGVFTFEGLIKGDMDIDDGSTYDPENPPAAATIGTTLYYQANNKATEGIVMIAAAAANFFTVSPSTATFTAFKAKFKVKPGLGNGKYPIGIQKTIIGPDTAANAGYDVPTLLEVAAGLAPDADPTTAQTYSVLFSPGLITVSGGYKVSGTAAYEPSEPLNGPVVNLIKVLDAGEFVVDSQAIRDGAYSFAQVPSDTYKVEILSSRPGFQKRYISASFDVAGADKALPAITLAEYVSISGKITINSSDQYLSGLRVVIKDGDGNVIGTAAVDANGNYVTPPLPTPLGTIAIYAVYGTQEVDITADPNYDWTTLSLGIVSGTLTGLCDDQEVEIFIRSETAEIQKATMVTGASGSNDYTLYNLLPGTDYILSVVGEAVAVFYDDTEDFSNATPVVVTADTDTAARDFAFTCGDLKTISGNVTIDGTIQSGVTVSANNFNFTTWRFGSAVTDSNGDFVIKVAPSNDYYVYFEKDGFRYYHKTGSDAVTSRIDASKVDVTAADAADIDIPLVIPVADTAKLEGYVTLNRSLANKGIPLANYLVVLTTTDNIPIIFTRTDETGYYSFMNLAGGTYNVRLEPPSPYAKQINEGVVLVNDTTVTSNFIVDQNFRITGDVLDIADGTTPVVSARVDILKSDGRILRSPAYTNSLGAYSLYDIPAGVYTLWASHKDFYPESEDGVQVISDLSAVDIQMTKGAIISGVVSDTNGFVKDAIVTLRGATYAKSMKTNASGFYQFNGLAANTTHMIKAAKGTDYVPYDPATPTTGDIGSTTTQDMTLVIPTTTWTFGGTITEDSTPVSNAYVLIFSSTTLYRNVVKTNTSGVFMFYKVIDGTDYSLLVLPGGGKPEFLETGVTINADETDHNIAIPTFATISGTITLSEADANEIVTAGAYDPLTDVVHEVKTENPSGDNTIFTYSIMVKTGVDYKVFAQGLTGTFPLKYYASDQASTTGTYAQSTAVTNDTSGVDITLTKN